MNHEIHQRPSEKHHDGLRVSPVSLACLLLSARATLIRIQRPVTPKRHTFAILAQERAGTRRIERRTHKGAYGTSLRRQGELHGSMESGDRLFSSAAAFRHGDRFVKSMSRIGPLGSANTTRPPGRRVSRTLREEPSAMSTS